jgi:hypothetical protein
MLSTHPLRINNTNQLFKTEIMKQLEINIHLKYVTLKGDFNSEGATGIVVFSHGSGSSRFSTRNKMVAGLIQKRKIATLLFDMEEDSDYEKRFDIDLLASRLIETTEWLMNHDEAKGLSILELVLSGLSVAGSSLFVIL